MKKITSFFAFCLLMVLLFACKVDLAFSQQPYDGPYVSIGHVYSEYDGNNFETQYFVAVIHYNKDQENVRFEDLIVTTTIGDIIFPPNKLKDSSESIVIGTLISPYDFKRLNINIIKAVANIGGTFYDLTNNVNLIEPLKLEMAMPSEQTKTCPNKILDYNVVEGIFKGLDCVDFCMIAIEVNGNSEFFDFYERNIGYFFEDEKNIGKKIKFVVETRQAFMYETEIEFGECVEITKITNFAVLSK